MKCPECEATGQKSKLYMPTAYISTAMGGSQSFYDEEGNRHHHEVNRRGGIGRCSNGHQLNVDLSTQCQAPGCDYGEPFSIEVRR